MILCMHVDVNLYLEDKSVVVDIVHTKLIHFLPSVYHEAKNAADVQVHEILRQCVLYFVLVRVESSYTHAKRGAHVVYTPDFYGLFWAAGFMAMVVATILQLLLHVFLN